MSTVLEKAVLLDETGQLIVDKLDDIKEAIGNSGEYIPLAIRVTTPPSKVSYYDGDALDLSGIVVSLVGSNGSLIDVTSACTFSPANGATLSTSDTSVAITYHYDKDNIDFTTTLPITVKVLTSITVTTPPTITNYEVDDVLDLSGIVVTGIFNDGSTLDITNQCIYSPSDGTVLTISDTTISISCTIGNVTKTTTQTITVILPIYGVEWDGTATSAWTRTDGAVNFTDPIPAVNNGDGSSPFDNISPWKDIEPVVDSVAGALVKIPKFYYKWTRDGSKMKLQIATEQFEGFKVSPAHADRGDGQGERDVVYVSRYHIAETFTSVGGVKPKVNYTRANFRSSIHNKGAEYWQWDYAMYWTIMMLYLVEFADWDSQSKIGHGCSDNGALENCGLTNSMVYHTGTNAVDRTTYGHTRYRYIEDLWGNAYDFVDGIYFSGAKIYCIKNPANFADSSGGTQVGTRSTSLDGIIKEYNIPSANDFEYAIFPSATTGAYNYQEYICDTVSSNSNNILVVGGSSQKTRASGAFYIDTPASSITSGGISSRLMKLPNGS